MFLHLDIVIYKAVKLPPTYTLKFIKCLREISRDKEKCAQHQKSELFNYVNRNIKETESLTDSARHFCANVNKQFLELHVIVFADITLILNVMKPLTFQWTGA